ncbi:hypothetical protein GQ44DRAFT_826514 [Phaeosphaeriaceae sp. PMI808]|nr:hypothetical protein GQ44DRAFT_826514 [Phaeosphaeriaceae sp. PMI808]
MSDGHYNDTAEIARKSNLAETRRLTGAILRDSQPPIPPLKDDPPIRGDHESYFQGVTTQPFYEGGKGRRSDVRENRESDDTFSDDLSDSSIGTSEDNPDPFVTVEERIADLQKQLTITENQLNHAKTELAIEQSRRPTNYNDVYFIEQMDGLRFKIRSWTQTYFSNTGNYWTSKAERRFQKITKDWAAYMEYKTHRPRLMQAYVWYTLQRLLFDPDSTTRFSYLFFGPGRYAVDKEFARASRESSNANRVTYREWRALTFTMLFPGEGRDINMPPYIDDEFNIRVKDVQREIWRPLWRYAGPDTSRGVISKARKSLKDIVLDAISFDLDMKKYTAEISVCPRSRQTGMPYDPDTMEAVTERQDGGRVGLVIAPPLYNTSSNIAKGGLLTRAQVCVGILERLPREGYQKALTPLITLDPNRTTNKREGTYHRPRSSSVAPRYRRQSHDSTRSNIERGSHRT